MKRLILALILTAFIAGTANASIYSDPSSAWGNWDGSFTEVDLDTGLPQTTNLIMTLGGDAGLHDPGSGYFYIPGVLPLGGTWTDSLTDSDGDSYSYSATITSAQPDQIQLTELATNNAWGSALTLAFTYSSSDEVTGPTISGSHWDLYGPDTTISGSFMKPTAVSVMPTTPIPGAVYLLGSGLLALAGFRRKKA